MFTVTIAFPNKLNIIATKCQRLRSLFFVWPRVNITSLNNSPNSSIFHKNHPSMPSQKLQPRPSLIKAYSF